MQRSPGFKLVAVKAVPALDDFKDSMDALKLAKKVHAGNFFGEMGKVCKNAKWQVDREKKSQNHTYLRLQRNGVPTPSTVASILIPNRLSEEFEEADTKLQKEMNKQLMKIIMKGFVLSERSHFEVRPGEWEIVVYRIAGAYAT